MGSLFLDQVVRGDKIAEGMKMKNIVALIAATILLPAFAQSAVLDVTPNSSFGSSIFSSGEGNSRIGSFTIFSSDVESLQTASVDVAIYVTGNVALQNLYLRGPYGFWQSNVLPSPVIGSGGNNFAESFLLPIHVVEFMDVFADVAGSGTVRVSILSGGVIAVGISSLETYQGPMTEKFSATQQVVGPVPEPGTFLMGSFALLGIGYLRRYL
jgi:hypothetical protein